MKKIYICSLKFAPGLFKEFTLLGKHFFENDTNVEYVLSKGYQSFFKKEKNVTYLTKSRNTKEMLLDLIAFPLYALKIKQILKNKHKNETTQFLFYNPHPLNPLLQWVIKTFSEATVITVLHEPYKTKKERMEYGLSGYIFFSIVNIFQIMSIKISDKIITMSPYGKSLYTKYFSKYSSKLVSANLLLPDLTDVSAGTRRYYSFIGRVNKGKGIQDFINTINYCVDNKIFNYDFMIITSSNIQEYISTLHQGWEQVLTVINHPTISDKEINDVIAQSKAVLILHQTASQSGVLPLAYQLKTPIIARNLKAFEQYIDGSGELLNLYFKPSELLEACQNIQTNFDTYSRNATTIYEANFSEKNFANFYKDIIYA